jgi:polysaccharide export outer membrane protein
MISRTPVSKSLGAAMALAVTSTFLAGCSFVGGSGPSARSVGRAPQHPVAGADVRVIDVTGETAQRLATSLEAERFSSVFGEGSAMRTVVGRGDTLDIQVWEAPPAMLFGNAMSSGGSVGSATIAGPATSIARGSTLPSQTVGDEGTITVPFAGTILAAGRTTREIARDIERRLAGKAHDPQVIVGRLDNVTSNVVVVGDVNQSNRLRLTAKGERLLDAIAGAGGTRQAADKSTIQITRGAQVAAMPLAAVIRDPRQNIRLKADDVVTVLYQPFSFTALGAVGRNAEIPFEGIGLTLSQALGRIGGLDDNRSNLRGAFIFRFEDPALVDPALVVGSRRTPDGKVPVIYRINLRDPATLFVAQSFPIRNKDVLYVSNAPIADFQKFLGVVSSTVFSVIGIANTIP